LQAIKTKRGAPIWLADKRITPAASGSIDKRAVVLKEGEMLFTVFAYSDRIEEIIHDRTLDEIGKLENINKEFGDEVLPEYIIDFIKINTKPYSGYIAIHDVRQIKAADTEYHNNLIRQRNVFGGDDLKKYQQALHHFMVLRNTLNQSRIVYWYAENIKIYENLIRKSNG
jgi:hypothetical protein